MTTMRPSFVLLSVLFSSLLIGCETNESTSPPPPPQELVGGPCHYAEKSVIAVVSDSNAEQVRFLIDGEIKPFSRNDLPGRFQYETGDRYRAMEKRIAQGTCTPYILEITGQADMPPTNQDRTSTFSFPDPSKY